MNGGENDNPYVPKQAIIEKITIENEARDLKTFRLSFHNGDEKSGLDFQCGQFAMLSVFGAGESPIGIASSPLDKNYVEFTMKRYPTGVLTTAMHDLEEGDSVGLRGPYGNWFPFETMEGKNVVIVGGGFAFTTLRSTIKYMLHDDNRARFKDITVVYGARNPGELLYKEELSKWSERSDIDMYVTVDKADGNWNGLEGFVPAVLNDAAPSSKNAIALLCGPPAMLKFTMPVFLGLDFKPEVIYTSLERRMSCGVGKCGHCSVSGVFVCNEGPIFTFGQIAALVEKVL
jgi:NAD(P)H-flavin reductase